MRNMKKWKRLMAVGLCCAMMFSMSVGVSATETQKTDETAVETEKVDEKADETADESDKNINKGETILQGDSGVSGNVDDEQFVQADGEELEEVEEIEKEEDEAAEYAIDTQADGEELPEMEWDGKFTVGHEKKEYNGTNKIEYRVTLGDEWKVKVSEIGNAKIDVYIDGVQVADQGAGYMSYTSTSLAYMMDIIELSSKPLNVTFKTELEHYSNGKVDGVAKDIEISFVTEIEPMSLSYHQQHKAYCGKNGKNRMPGFPIG